MICYFAIWRYIPSLFNAYNIFYSAVFPDMSYYVLLLIVGIIMMVLVSGIMTVGLVIKIARIVSDMLL